MQKFLFICLQSSKDYSALNEENYISLSTLEMNTRNQVGYKHFGEFFSGYT